MGVKANQVIAKLMGPGVWATGNQALDVDTATGLPGNKTARKHWNRHYEPGWSPED